MISRVCRAEAEMMAKMFVRAFNRFEWDTMHYGENDLILESHLTDWLTGIVWSDAMVAEAYQQLRSCRDRMTALGIRTGQPHLDPKSEVIKVFTLLSWLHQAKKDQDIALREAGLI